MYLKIFYWDFHLNMSINRQVLSFTKETSLIIVGSSPSGLIPATFLEQRLLKRQLIPLCGYGCSWHCEGLGSIWGFVLGDGISASDKSGQSRRAIFELYTLNVHRGMPTHLWSWKERTLNEL